MMNTVLFTKLMNNEYTLQAAKVITNNHFKY